MPAVYRRPKDGRFIFWTRCASFTGGRTDWRNSSTANCALPYSGLSWCPDSGYYGGLRRCISGRRLRNQEKTNLINIIEMATTTTSAEKIGISRKTRQDQYSHVSRSSDSLFLGVLVHFQMRKRPALPHLCNLANVEWLLGDSEGKEKDLRSQQQWDKNQKYRTTLRGKYYCLLYTSPSPRD